MTRYRCVAARKAEGFEVTRACAAAGVSTSAYYAWAAAPAGPSAAEWDEAQLVDAIRDLHDADDTRGSPRITAALRRAGWAVNHKRVERLMRDNGIAGHTPRRRRRSLTKPDQQAPVLVDRVGRRFDPGPPDVTWAGDITYIPTDEGWLYLAGVLDLGSRRLIGHAMAATHDAGLVVNALEAAVTTRGLAAMEGTIFHADRGAEYTSAACRAACERLGLEQSASRTGSCLDNAVAESFFGTLKVELVNRVRFATRDQARAAIFAWLIHYNHRLHSTLGYLPPVEWEAHYYHHPHPLPTPMAA